MGSLYNKVARPHSYLICHRLSTRKNKDKWEREDVVMYQYEVVSPRWHEYNVAILTAFPCYFSNWFLETSSNTATLIFDVTHFAEFILERGFAWLPQIAKTMPHKSYVRKVSKNHFLKLSIRKHTWQQHCYDTCCIKFTLISWPRSVCVSILLTFSLTRLYK